MTIDFFLIFSCTRASAARSALFFNANDCSRRFSVQQLGWARSRGLCDLAHEEKKISIQKIKFAIIFGSPGGGEGDFFFFPPCPVVDPSDDFDRFELVKFIVLLHSGRRSINSVFKTPYVTENRVSRRARTFQSQKTTRTTRTLCRTDVQKLFTLN